VVLALRAPMRLLVGFGVSADLGLFVVLSDMEGLAFDCVWFMR
jgi:hypothetical protein